jgi:hypothetical protein
MNDIVHVIKFSLDLVHLLRNFLNFLSFDFKLFLLGCKVLLEGLLLLLLLLKLLGDSKLVSPLLIKLTFSLEQLLLLFHGLLHSLRSMEELLFHSLNFLQELLLF